MKVVCINDKNLPLGAEVVEGRTYTVANVKINIYDEVAYIIAGVNNEGVSKFGVKWTGYKSTRFAELENITGKEVNHKEEVIL